MMERSINLKELAEFDGREGRPAYVAVNGKVYDVSTSERWQQGNHEGTHQAGADLSEELKAAPHVRAVIERFPVVAHLNRQQESSAAAEKGGGGKLWLLAAGVIVVVVLWLVVGR